MYFSVWYRCNYREHWYEYVEQCVGFDTALVYVQVLEQAGRVARVLDAADSVVYQTGHR